MLLLPIHSQDRSVIQFSGMVYTHLNGKDYPLPYVGVGIVRTRRGAFTNENGFFSFATETGDTILFNSLGYKLQRLAIPKDLKTDRFYANVLLEQDTFQLERAIVYSIPSRAHFKPEFLEMDVSDKLKDRAQQNLAQEVLEQLAPYTPSDGRAGVSLYFAQEAQKAVYAGQFKPQQIFNVFAWAQFLEALKRGDFSKNKKKKKQKQEDDQTP